MRKYKLHCFAILVVVVLFAADSVMGGVWAEERTYDKRFDDARAKIIEFVKESGVASVSVAVAKDGKIIWEEAFGWANREKRIKATPHTMYSLASISKPITATGLMVLVERGHIDINKPVNSYLARGKLTAYEGNVSEATVKRLLHHTAGLPMHWHFFVFACSMWCRSHATQSSKRCRME